MSGSIKHTHLLNIYQDMILLLFNIFNASHQAKANLHHGPEFMRFYPVFMGYTLPIDPLILRIDHYYGLEIVHPYAQYDAFWIYLTE